MKMDSVLPAGTSAGLWFTQCAAVRTTCGETVVPVHHVNGLSKVGFLIRMLTAPLSAVASAPPTTADTARAGGGSPIPHPVAIARSATAAIVRPNMAAILGSKSEGLRGLGTLAAPS